MSKKNLVKVVSPTEGYNHISKQYKTYHRHLNSFDHGIWQKFLPRDLTGQVVVDLGAGDGRIFSYFRDTGISEFHACDGSENLLSEHPNGQIIHKHVFDLEEKFPLEDESADIVTTFFTIEYIKHLQDMFLETYRILAPGGIFLIGDYIQYRSFIFKDGANRFKIKRYAHTQQAIVEALEYAFFEVIVEPIYEKTFHIGEVYICKK